MRRIQYRTPILHNAIFTDLTVTHRPELPIRRHKLRSPSPKSPPQLTDLSPFSEMCLTLCRRFTPTWAPDVTT